ncbi:MAG: hypothetical protein IKC99_03180 [Clostridia bacterium]|nr:hypothetical protein [Clostridia bacterium]MBR7137039.1 hypothetical protein [Clostridia bacterium]
MNRHEEEENDAVPVRKYSFFDVLHNQNLSADREAQRRRCDSFYYNDTTNARYNQAIREKFRKYFVRQREIAPSGRAKKENGRKIHKHGVN